MIKIIVSALCCFMLVSCSSSSITSDPAADTLLTGVFLDSAVEGISYRTDAESGITNAAGEYSYADGESVTFSIGTLDFPTVVARPVVTPVEMSSSENIFSNVSVNIARLLQSLDEDGDLDNGIQIPEQAASSAIPVDFNVEPDVFSVNTDVINLVANSGSMNTQLVEVSDAEDHLEQSILESGFGRITDDTIDSLFDTRLFLFNGEEQIDNFITVMSDGTFSGTWEGEPIAATWEMRDDFFCRILIEFHNPEAIDIEDCQLWTQIGNQVRGQRDRGNGVAFFYNIVE